jgi:ferrous iron transport protein A
MKPLSDLTVGAAGIVGQLRGGRDFAGRMAGLGFTPGVNVAVIQNYGHGPMIVTVRETRVALGRWEAAKVLVRMANKE